VFRLSLLVSSSAMTGCQSANTAGVSIPNMQGFGATLSSTVRHASVPDRLYIANQGSSDGNIAVYSAGGKSFVKDISKHVAFPISLALAGTNLYVGDERNVLVFDVSDGKLTSTLSQDVDDPVSLALDSSGTLYVANSVSYYRSNIAVFTHGKFSHSVTEGIDGPGNIAVDKSQSLYVPDGLSSSVTVYAKGAKAPKLTITKGIARPIAVALDSDGNVYVCNVSGSDVTVYKNGSTSPLRTLTTGFNPSAFAVSENGYVYVAITEPSSGSLYEDEIEIFKPGATKPSTVVPYGYDYSYEHKSLAVDDQNDLYVGIGRGVGVFDATTGKLLRRLDKHISIASALVFGN
jgi:hypothetical protein